MSSILILESSFAAAWRHAQSPAMKILVCLASAAAIGTTVNLQYRAITPRLSSQARACEERLTDRLAAIAGYQRVSVRDSGEKNVRGEQLVVIRYDARDAAGAPVRETEVCRYDPRGKLIGETPSKLAIERVIDSLTKP